MNRFILTNTKLCIGCRTCEIACVVAHNGGEIDSLDATNFHPRLKVLKAADVTGVVMCRQCEFAPCVNACPNGAIFQDKDSVQVVQEKCIGCKTCVLACPYGAMSVVSQSASQTVFDVTIADALKAEAQKCDLCESRGDNKGPACVESCPTKALYIVDQYALLKMRNERKEATLERVCGLG